MQSCNSPPQQVPGIDFGNLGRRSQVASERMKRRKRGEEGKAEYSGMRNEGRKGNVLTREREKGKVLPR